MTLSFKKSALLYVRLTRQLAVGFEFCLSFSSWLLTGQPAVGFDTAIACLS